jgi:hypothetical protein
VLGLVARGLLAAGTLLVAGTANGRSGEQLFFRVDLASGRVQRLSKLDLPRPVAGWPPPVLDERRSVTSRDGTLILLEGDPVRYLDRKITWQHTIGPAGGGWLAWRVLQRNIVTYLWREPIPGQRDQHREIIRALDMNTRKTLWERVGPLYEPPAGAPLGFDHLLVDQPKEVLLLETRTGRVVRQFPKSDDSFAAARPAAGRLWMEAGGFIECLDEATTRTLWRFPKTGRLVWLVPIPGSDDWLVKTASHAYRIRAADGGQIWSAQASSVSRPLIHGDRIYEGVLEDGRSSTGTKILVVVRDLQTGRTLRAYPLGQYPRHFDQGTAAAVGARAGTVDVAAKFIVYE